MADVALYSNGAFSMETLKRMTPGHFNIIVDRTNAYLKAKAKANGSEAEDLISA